jgi:hypothetical protein
MLSPEQKQALVSLGYRPLPSDEACGGDERAWGKPIGYSLLTVIDCKSEIIWEQWFRGGDDQQLVWDRQTWDPIWDSEAEKCTGFARWLMYVENYRAKVPCMYTEADYAFLSIAEQLQL